MIRNKKINCRSKRMNRTNFIIILIILGLVFMLFIGLLMVVVSNQSEPLTRETCLTTGNRTDCFRISITDGIDRFKNKYTRVVADPVFEPENNSVFNMVYTCSFNPSDLLKSSVLFGAGNDRPHTMRMNKEDGTMEIQFYSTYRRLDFEIRPFLKSFQVKKITSTPYPFK